MIFFLTFNFRILIIDRFKKINYPGSQIRIIYCTYDFRLNRFSLIDETLIFNLFKNPRVIFIFEQINYAN